MSESSATASAQWRTSPQTTSSCASRASRSTGAAGKLPPARQEGVHTLCRSREDPGMQGSPAAGPGQRVTPGTSWFPGSLRGSAGSPRPGAGRRCCAWEKRPGFGGTPGRGRRTIAGRPPGYERRGCAPCHDLATALGRPFAPGKVRPVWRLGRQGPRRGARYPGRLNRVRYEDQLSLGGSCPAGLPWRAARQRTGGRLSRGFRRRVIVMSLKPAFCASSAARDPLASAARWWTFPGCQRDPQAMPPGGWASRARWCRRGTAAPRPP
jgi:hypothetical protein